MAREVQETPDRVGIRHYYWCPGCEAETGFGLHGIAINPNKQGNGAGWDFSGTLECPTYAPSQKTEGAKKNPNGGEPIPTCCHTFIRNGVIEFLGDCTHALKGQKVPMVPLPDWFVKED